MKNTFKYIAAFVALVSGFAVSAQNLKEGTYMTDNGIAYAKRATVNNDGTYTIDLETFVAGEVTQTFEVHPADIVLVLDVSGSMDETINEYVYTARSHENITGGTRNWNNNVKDITPESFIKFNNEYYQVYRGRGGTNNNRHYFIFFTVNGVRHFINSSGSIVTEEPTNITGSGDNLWPSSVTLYTRTSQSTGTTKMDALKTAVKAFIDQIAHNDLYEDDTDDKPRLDEGGNPAPLGNQISIVKFGLATYYNTTSWPTNATQQENLLKAGNHYCDYNGYSYSNYTTTFDDNYNITEVLAEFTPTASSTNVTTLKNAVDGFHAAGATAADYGMKLAYELVNRLGDDRSDSRKTVVFFTDGAPTHGSNFDNTVANNAITNSGNIKAISYTVEVDGEETTIHPTVFSVGIFSDGGTEQIRNFMTSVATSSDYFMDASGGTADDLKNIFKAIAHSAGGSGNTDVSGTSSLTVDVVSSSFSVPTDFESASDVVEVLVAPCIGQTTIDGTKYLTFGEALDPSEYDLPAITPSINVNTNTVSTTGFDYSTNWCGPDPTNIDPNSIQTGYHGFKQIIRFVITVNDDAVGGPAVNTNTADSGIYLEGATEPLIKFNRPNVKLPVQIWIQKSGLKEGESAVFTLYRSPFQGFDTSDPEKNTWENFTKVVVNSGDLDSDGMVKIVGLDPDFFYRLKEDAWAFGYTYQENDVLYTVGDNVQNPFEFVNTPKPIKYAEAVARNVFKEKTSTSGGDEGGSGEGGSGE